MKKLFFTLALALGLAASVSAQETGLFGYGPAKGGYENYSTDYETRESVFNLPNQHGSSDDVSAPLGMGTAILLSLGAAYLANKKRKNQKSYNTRFFLMAAVMTAGIIGALPNSATGQEKDDPSWIYTFKSPDAISNNSITVNGAKWDVSTTTGTGSPTMTSGNTYGNYGLKFGNSGSAYYGSVTLTTNYFNNYNVKSVSVDFLNNGKKTGTFTVVQGNTTIGQKTKDNSYNEWFTLTANTTSGSGGSLSLTYSIQQAFYIKKITVVYEIPTTPTCTVNPTSYDFGNVQVGSSTQTHNFTVTPQNLQHGLSFSLKNYYYYSINQSGMGANETSKTITVTLDPFDIGEMKDTLVISGQDFAEDILVPLAATGTCTEPENALAFTTPINLTLSESDIEYQLIPSGGNGGDITYEITDGDENHGTVIDDTFTADAIGTWVVTATQDLNNGYCGSSVNITINVIGTDPMCSIIPAIYDFGKVPVNTSKQTTFSVATANLTGDLSVSIDHTADGFSVTPTTIEQNATSPTILTVTFAPTAATADLTAELTISGGGLESSTTALISGQGDEGYTITFNAGTGSCATTSVTNFENHQFTLPTATPSSVCATAGWTFVGWATSSVAETTTAPTLLNGTYTITSEATLYAVYRLNETLYNDTEFNFGNIASANSWADATAYTKVEINPITIETKSGGNNGKYYTNDKTWRMYNNGSFTITTSSGSISSVSSDADPTTTFTVSNGSVSKSFSGTTKFKSITVTYGVPSTKYATNAVVHAAAPTFSIASGTTVVSGTKVSLSCDTDGSTIYYSLNNSNTYTEYTTPIVITGETTIAAYATADGYEDSESATASYNVYSTCAVTFNCNGTNALTVDVPQGAVLDLRNYSAPVISETYSFVGWSSSSWDNTKNTPRTSMIFTPSANETTKTLYAVYSYGTVNYQLVTVATDLEIGDYVVIAASGYDKAISKTQGSDNRSAASINKSTNNNTNTITLTSNVCEFKLQSGSNTDTWAFWDEEKNGYLYAGGSSNALLKTQTTLNAQGSWSIEISNNIASIVANGSNTNKTMQYKNSNNSDLFACFASASENSLSLYRKVGTFVTTLSGLIPTSTITEVPGNAVVKVLSGTILTLTGSNNGTAANLIVEDGGQLIVESTGAKDGGVQATIEKNITGYGTDNSVKTGWNFIASPITGSISPTVVDNLLGEKISTDPDPAEYNYDLYRLDNTNWENYHQHNESADPFLLENGQGYLYAKSSNTTLSFAGTVKPFTTDNNANQVALSEGWNLVGNPYTFNVYSNKSYYKITTSNNTDAITAVTSPSDYIAPCSGIIVKGSVTFTEEPAASWSTGNKGNIQMTLAQTVASRGESSSTKLDNAIVSFNESDQLEKFYFGTQNANIYLPQNGKEYAIATSDMQGEMPVNFVAAEDGQYTITVNAENVEMGYLHLIDNLTGADVDLLATPSYTFNAKWDDYASRFRLVFSANNTNSSIEDSDEDFAFISNGQIIINGNTSNATLQTVDMLGRVVNTQQVNGNTAQMAPVANGVYVLRLIDGTDMKSQKIVVR